MKRLKTLSTMCAAAGLGFGLVLGVSAQQAQTRAEQSSGQQSSASLEQGQAGQMQMHELSELEGIQVESRDGESLGSIASLAVDLQGEHPSFIVVESGGLLGIGADLKVVPIEAVEITEEDRTIGQRQVVRVDIDQAQWEEIPIYEESEIIRLCDESQAREVYQHFNLNFEESRQMQFGGRSGSLNQQSQELQQSQEDQQSEELQQSQEDQQSQIETQSDQSEENQQEFGRADRDSEQEEEDWADLERRRDEAAAQQSNQQEQAEESSEQREVTTFGGREQSETGATERQTQTRTTQRTTASSVGECELVMTRDLRGRDIHDSQRASLGTVDDVVFNSRTGRVEYVLIVPETGLLERSNEVFALSPGSFRTVSREQVTVEVTREQLEQAETLTQTTIQQRSQAGPGQQTGDQPQVFRFERDQITFGSPDRSDDEETQSPRQTEGQTDDGARTQGTSDQRPPPHAQDRDRRGPPPHAQDPDRRGPPPHAQGREREGSSPEARDREFQGRDQDANESTTRQRGTPTDSQQNQEDDDEDDAQSSQRSSGAQESDQSGQTTR